MSQSVYLISDGDERLLGTVREVLRLPFPGSTRDAYYNREPTPRDNAILVPFVEAVRNAVSDMISDPDPEDVSVTQFTIEIR